MASDSFNRADAGSLGGSWTETTNGLKIVSNKADTVNFTGARQLAYYAGAASGSDQFSKIVTQASLGTLNFNAYLCTRLQGSGSGQDAHLIYWGDGQGGSSVNIGYLIDDALTTLSNTGVALAVGDTVRIESEGTSIRAYKNGAQAGSTQTESTVSGGQPGFGGGFTGYDVFDDWEGGNLGAVAVPVFLFHYRQQGIS